METLTKYHFTSAYSTTTGELDSDIPDSPAYSLLVLELKVESTIKH